MEQPGERSLQSHLIEEYLVLNTEIAFLNVEKRLAADKFIVEKTVSAGAELISANVELAKATNQRQTICRAIASRIVNEAISSSALS